MRRLTSLVGDFESASLLGPVAIAAGLVMLAAAMIWPGLPALTAMALIALGATRATYLRFHASPNLASIMLAHLAVYATLYFLFVGAVLHSAGGGFRSFGVIADLGLSVIPLVAALAHSWRAVRADRWAE